MAAQKKSDGGSRSGGGSGTSGRSGGSNKSSSGAANRSRSTRQSGNGSAPSQSSRSRAAASSRSRDSSEDPDVLLDVSQLKVDEISLEVENLHARISLEARLGDLLHLHVGADVVVDKVALEIKGVDAQAQLKARLDNVLTIIDRTLKTVDQHPEVLTELAGRGDETVAAAHEALDAGGNDADDESESEPRES